MKSWYSWGEWPASKLCSRQGGSYRFRNSALQRFERMNFYLLNATSRNLHRRLHPTPTKMVWPRPPTRSRASSTMVERPEFSSARAAPRPAAPAPMMVTSVSEGKDISWRVASRIQQTILRINVSVRHSLLAIRLYATASLAFSARLRSLASRNFLRSRIDFGVTSTSSSSSI